MNTIQESLATIKTILQNDSNRNIFKSYIEYIRFPLFKKFESNIKVEFSFPITFLVGPNGSGKSSVLQALYGAPMGKSTSDYWFSTVVDPIRSEPGTSHSYIYGFKSPISKNNAEVLKIRRSNSTNPDYWEPARPQISLDMETEIPDNATEEEVPTSRERWSPLAKAVKYMDFRYELSAFDKYFYFGEKPNTITMKSKQDYLRRYAKPLKNAIGLSRYFYMSRRSSSKELSEEALEAISYILGKAYTSATIIEHDFYKKGVKNFSVYYTTKYGSYSEAFSGSGETAVVRLVNDVIDAEPNSLLLLDEPETSLHPGAQKKLIQFILDQVVQKKLQVVISTHSSHIIEGMPKEAINVFTQSLATGHTSHLAGVRPEEAFYHIGNTLSYKKLIVVEDILAKNIIQHVLNDFGEHTSNLFEVRFYTGGESYITNQLIPIFSKDARNEKFVVFDGDQKPVSGHCDPQNLRDADKNKANLNHIIEEQTGKEVKFYPDGGEHGGREDQVIELQIEYLNYYQSHVHYLPKTIPEEIIWSDEMLTKLDSEEIKQKIKSENNFKEKFRLFTDFLFGDASSETIQIAHKMFITKFHELNPMEFNLIKSTIQAILDGNSYNFD